MSSCSREKKAKKKEQPLERQTWVLTSCLPCVCEQVQFYKENGLLGKKNNRRRDAFTKYLEASARYKLLMKKGNGK